MRGTHVPLPHANQQIATPISHLVQRHAACATYASNTAAGFDPRAGGVECVLWVPQGNVANFVETGEGLASWPTGRTLWRGGGRPARVTVCTLLSRTDPCPAPNPVPLPGRRASD